jgi:N-acetyl sugar amidotransferase
MPQYCKKCILPDTRPGVLLDSDGICRGCRNALTKAGIDWDARAAAFQELAHNARSHAKDYDCVIPVSGGKDSYWQVLTCLEHGLRPLCVTYVYPRRTDLGERNLRQLLRVGVDHIEFRPNPKVERRFIERSFFERGISGLATHMAIYSIPLRVAVKYDIPLIVFGENSAFEYGSEDDRYIGSKVDRSWVARFGVTDGTTASDWVDTDLGARDLAMYTAPDDDQLAAKGVRAVFLGYYFPWDPENSRRIAVEHGFRARPEGPRVGHYDFVNIDDDLLGVHHHAKWYKFGITRSWDTLSMEIRSGRLSRQDAIEELRRLGDETPWSDIELFCEYLGITKQVYFETLERFRNNDIWVRRGGKWMIEDFLITDFPWASSELSDWKTGVELSGISNDGSHGVL